MHLYVTKSYGMSIATISCPERVKIALLMNTQLDVYLF